MASLPMKLQKKKNSGFKKGRPVRPFFLPFFYCFKNKGFLLILGLLILFFIIILFG